MEKLPGVELEALGGHFIIINAVMELDRESVGISPLIFTKTEPDRALLGVYARLDNS
jgi:hypothetical protein